ncbi:MAG: hypothetical protein LUI87_09130 [Lachnospiraceae bacterium]|nr:hypothetical protein [Lachnospiraceae bacterium]
MDKFAITSICSKMSQNGQKTARYVMPHSQTAKIALRYVCADTHSACDINIVFSCQDIIRLLLEEYREHDIDELTSMRILNMPEFIQKGTPPAIVKRFGGKEKYMEMLSEIEVEIYSETAMTAS